MLFIEAIFFMFLLNIILSVLFALSFFPFIHKMKQHTFDIILMLSILLIILTSFSGGIIITILLNH